MKILIIEDEKLIAEDLAKTLKEIDPKIEIIAILSSVAKACFYLENPPHTDLIFSDVQLGDGLCFEIFNRVEIKSPIIFCTGYDDYALPAFKTNGIEYILKPFSKKSIAAALEKFHQLKNVFTGDLSRQHNAAIESLAAYEKKKSASFMIKYRDAIIPIAIENIALFYLENQISYLHTFKGKYYAITESIEELEKIAGESFFRVNRQFLINQNAIQSATTHFPRKLKVTLNFPFETEITVGKQKKTRFLDWLQNK